MDLRAESRPGKVGERRTTPRAVGADRPCVQTQKPQAHDAGTSRPDLKTKSPNATH